MAQFEENCEIRKSEQLGRFLVAKRDLTRGQQILVERPIVVGPYWDSDISCLNCFKNSCTICRKCRRAPLCYDCTEHDATECEFYRESNLDINFLFDHFDVVTPVRCLLLVKANREQFDEMMTMEAHLEERRGSDIWNIHRENVVRPLLGSGIFASYSFDDLVVDEELLQRFCGIMDVNAFDIRGNVGDQEAQMNCMVRGLYAKTSLGAHSCVPNTLVSVDGNSNLRLYAAIPVKKGELLSYNYTSCLFGTFERRAHLKNSKYFVCTCVRCEDPTELGTHLSSVRCTSCESGLCSYYPVEDQWVCNKCQQQLSRDYVKQVFVAARNDAMDCPPDTHELELLIAKHSKTLNPNNSLVLEMKQTLAGELRNQILMATHPSKVPKQLLQRKFDLCQEILPILRVLQPGISRLVGIALYEYNTALWDLARRNFEEKEFGSGQLLDNLISAETGLKESIGMLLFEHPTTPEGQLTKKAMQNLKELREEITQIRRVITDEKKECGQ